jgi:hypothetical protein
MLAQAVAGTLDLNDDDVVKQPVQQRNCDDGIAKNFAPFAEAAIRGQDHRPPLVAGVDQLEEQIAGAGADGEIADLIDDQQRGTAQEPDAFAQAPFAVSLGERLDDVGERREVDAAAGPDCLDAECRGQMTLAGAGLADEVELCQGEDPVAVERRLEREVEAGQRLDGGQARHLQRRLDPAALANGDLLGQQRLDRLDRAQLATLELLNHMLERASPLMPRHRSRRDVFRLRRRTPEDAVRQHRQNACAQAHHYEVSGCWPGAASCDDRRGYAAGRAHLGWGERQ